MSQETYRVGDGRDDRGVVHRIDLRTKGTSGTGLYGVGVEELLLGGGNTPTHGQGGRSVWSWSSQERMGVKYDILHGFTETIKLYNIV